METLIISNQFGESHLVKLAIQEALGKAKIAYTFPPATEVGVLSFDPSSLIVSGTALLTALLSGLFSYLATKNRGVIEIIGKSGRKVVIPVDKATQLGDIVKAAKALDAPDVTELIVAPGQSAR
jgi:hypothetical protein